MQLLVVIVLFYIIPSFPFWILKARERKQQQTVKIPVVEEKHEQSFEAQIRYVRYKMDDLNVTKELIEEGVLYDKYGNKYGSAALLEIEAQIEKLRNQLIRLEAK